ncbi:MAG: phosphatidate cytidylyltransferase [Gammaproteobacteria bacterium HGW-Gammaproteobacteria-10]|nr:MAG: phosphatidate cytidylyltransferase [Gammaproteobacteria bacterium HGW-Gammaproteobacteria-10]
MLLQRIITALILAPLVVLAVYLLPIPYFTLIVALVMLVAAWEWTSLTGIDRPSMRILFLVLLILPMGGVYFWTYFLEIVAQIFDWPEVRAQSGLLEWLVILPVLFWVVVMFLIRNASDALLKLELKTVYKGLTGWLILFFAWMFLYRMRAFYGADMVMYFLLLIWVADITAYFVGKKFGATKLAPEISPGKTMAGFYGALGSAVVSAIVLSLAFGFNLMIGSDFVLLSVLTVLISIYGDLFFSLVKRQRGVKDTGSILPGHGGLLDRVDSLVAAIPFFYAGILLIKELF